MYARLRWRRRTSIPTATVPGDSALSPRTRRSTASTPIPRCPAPRASTATSTRRAKSGAPPAGAIFGYADQPGMTVGCVNPALPGSHDWVKLDSYWFARSTLPVPGGPVVWSTEGPPPTSYLHAQGLVSAKCFNDGQRGYLWV